ncbi:MAG: zinc carboxypeptidase [Lutibacter sp.]|uniref:M14 family metallopeptidase n=1 Tax=Lutibacter sp. TaxID=1925666 RepID=UPI00179EBAE4|nr:M14 family metallopeptidase [Lutibacter sp.]MBT8316183.1 zinc carboxypeptidase [Lutibacter sp.]NNJ57043.1 zinc carboxypeptidase [Lutibacter sp.]
MKQITFLIALLFSLVTSAQNQFELSYYLPQNATYNKTIPTPESVIGFRVGEWHVTHDKLVEYLKILAASSDRISLEDRGQTFEGRPLLLLTITSPQNHSNIKQIQEEHLKLSLANESSQLVVSEMPVVVYQGFSIHGNEPSGANAGMVLAYYLAAAEGNEIENLLNNTVILLDPSLNPDGLQRFTYWANTNKSKHNNTDSNDREFHEVWPGGRTNHYWFDMNRDWLPVQLPESRARIESYRNWMPNVLTDHHEMGSNSTFFFQPGIQSRVNPLTPKENQILTKEIATYHAKALDKIGSLYFTEEAFDDFYYGKGSTYPDVNGGVGILFEQGSSRGHAQETINGVLTFPFTIRNQFTAALSTLEASNGMREKLLEYQRRFYKNASKEADKDQVKAIVFGDDKDVAKTYHLAEILKRHKINFYKPKSDLLLNGKKFNEESSFIVPTNQKNYKLIKAMFNTQTKFEDSLFYDISAWTFPLAFNLDYESLKSTANIGEIVSDLQPVKGKVTSKSNYAYLMEWHEYYTPKVLNKILQKGIRAKVGMKPFSLEGINYDYGTILISVQNQKYNQDKLFTILNEIAGSASVTIKGVNTGLTNNGIDLGSNQFRIINTPKVAMIIGNGVTSYDAGEIWHLFDQRYEMNITKLDESYLSRVDLSKYTTIILPSSRLQLTDTNLKKIKDWVSNGGTLIGYKNAVKWLSSNKFIKLDYATVKVDAKDVSFEQKRDFSGAQVIGGSIFETKLDRSHPINFGYKSNKLPMFRRTKIFIKPDSSSYNNPIKYTANPLLSGYISKPNLEVLKNTVPFQVKNMGKGKVMVFTDNTNFRAFWYGTNKLLMNAIFFAKEM